MRRVLTLFVGIVLWTGLASQASAHDWYPTACCDQRDCRPATMGEFDITPEGYRWKQSGQIIPFDHVAPVGPPFSPDGELHICVVDIGGHLSIRRRSDGLCAWVTPGADS